MSNYSFPIPHPRGFRQQDSMRKCNHGDTSPIYATDVILNILHARITSSNNTTHEFETLYDADNNCLELDIPDCYMDFLEDIEVGPNIKRYLRWLVDIAVDSMANNLVWKTMDELITIIPGNTFKTPDRFHEASLAVFLNGVRLEKSNDDGYTVLNDETFELKETYHTPRHRISVGYLQKS